MMELFSLGADRGAYSEDDIREAGAGADRLAQRLVGRARRPQLPLRPQTPRHQTRRSSAGPATGAGRTPAGSASSTPSTPPSSSTSSGATSSRSRRPTATARRADRHLPRLRLADPAGARDDPDQPRVLRRPGDGEAAGRPAGGDAARARPRHRHRRLGLALRTGRARCSSGPPTSPAGTTAAGSTPRGCGPAGTSSTTPSTRSPSTPGTARYSTTETADEALARALAVLGLAGAPRRAPGRAARFRPARARTRSRQLAARPLPGDAPERAAAADRRQPRHDPAMSRS